MSDNQITNQEKDYNKESREILKKFVEELNSSDIRKGEYPELASTDLKYTASLQRKRLNEKNADISYDYNTDSVIKGSAVKLDKDTRYITRMPFYIAEGKTEYSVGGKVKKREKLLKTMYANVIWLIDQNKNNNESHCCPNCGAVSTVKQLLSGCPYCKTRFLMNDLFPKITNYYDRRTKEEINSTVLPFSLLGILVVFMIMWISGMFSFDTLKSAFTSDDMTGKIIQGAMILGGAAVGAVSGPVLKIICNILYVLLYTIFYLPGMFRLIRTRRKLPHFMRSFEKNFTLDHFIGKLIYLIRMMVYSDNYDNCAVYCGEPTENKCKDIIDMTYFGFISAKNQYIENDYAYVDIDVTMYTFNCKGHRISKKTDVFNLLICKSIHAENDYGFSIHKIQCKNCGSSFDAAREKHCPFCKSEYNLSDYDWVVKNFKKK